MVLCVDGKEDYEVWGSASGLPIMIRQRSLVHEEAHCSSTRHFSSIGSYHLTLTVEIDEGPQRVLWEAVAV